MLPFTGGAVLAKTKRDLNRAFLSENP